MATVTNSEIVQFKAPIQIVDARQAAKKATHGPAQPSSGDGLSIIQYHADFSTVVGAEPSYSLLLSSVESSKNPFFHEACVYLPDHDELYVTSNLLQSTSSSQYPVILISKLRLHRAASGDVASVEWQKLRPPPNMPMPAGGTGFESGILFCAQGSMAPGTGGLYYMPHNQPPEAVVTNFHGRDFNSVHDVAVASDGSIWFTDPCHGFEKDIRERPQLPCQVYRFSPGTGDLRVVADGLGRPHGLALSPDESTLYVTDPDAAHANGEQDVMRSATIYAFDIVIRSGSPFLTEKRVFAYAAHGIPMGIKCDRKGNVYAGCADGVEVWNPGGTLIGVIEVPGGVTNLGFGQDGELFLCAEQRLWRLKTGTIGTLIGV